MNTQQDISKVTIVQLTDSHLGSREDYLVRSVNTLESLFRVAKKAALEEYDFVACTGDISDIGTKDSYIQFLKLVNKTNLNNVFCVPGNHDDTANMESVLGKEFIKKRLFSQNWLFLTINTHVPNQNYGYISSDQIEQLMQSIQTNPDRFVSIFMHHHTVPVNSSWIDKSMLRNADEFITTIQSYSNVRAVVCGHVHQDYRVKHGHISFICSPSTCMQFKRLQHEFCLDSLPPAYRMLYFHSNGKVSTEVKYIEPFSTLRK